MFGDWGFIDGRYDVQHDNYAKWMKTIEGKKLAIIEIGMFLLFQKIYYSKVLEKLFQL
jgi:hypothetical protein